MSSPTRWPTCRSACSSHWFRAARRRCFGSASRSAAGAVLSFGMETLQMFLPTRDASLIDLLSNAGGAFAGGLVARHARARGAHAAVAVRRT